jgi:hypothetical protein
VNWKNDEVYWLLYDSFLEKTNLSELCDHCETLETAPETFISFVASHFFEIDRLFLLHLPVSTLDRVLSHESLKLESENSLYDFVISIIIGCSEGGVHLATDRVKTITH